MFDKALVRGLLAAALLSITFATRSDGATITIQVQPLADIWSGFSSSNPDEFTAYNGSVYFRASDPTHGRELWRYGPGGVQLVADVISGSTSSYPGAFTVFQNELYFRASKGSLDDFALWRYDGSSVSQASLLYAGASPNYASDICVFQNRLYFALREPSTGIELWSYDGANLALAANINPDPTDSFFVSYGSSWPSHFQEYAGNLYFQACSSTSAGYQPWRFNGTTASLAADLRGFSPFIFNGALYFTAQDKIQNGTGLWRLDGASVSQIPTDGIVINGNMTVVGNNLYFVASDAAHGTELWRFDGTTVSLAADINPGPNGSMISNLAAMGDMLFFSAVDKTVSGPQGGQVTASNSAGVELWVYDGVTASLAADINPGAGSSSPGSLFGYENHLYFAAVDGVHGSELWVAQIVPEPSIIVFIITAAVSLFIYGLRR
jgi:ELWxxDGT repeat protein